MGTAPTVQIPNEHQLGSSAPLSLLLLSHFSPTSPGVTAPHAHECLSPLTGGLMSHLTRLSLVESNDARAVRRSGSGSGREARTPRVVATGQS